MPRFPIEMVWISYRIVLMGIIKGGQNKSVWGEQNEADTDSLPDVVQSGV